MLDSGCRMDRPAPPRKTVYRISLTLVKRESLDKEETIGNGAEKEKVRVFRRENSADRNGTGLLEQLQETDNEMEEFTSTPFGIMRNFRTFSTGQIDLYSLQR